MRLAQVLPYLRQEGAALAVPFEDDAIDPGTQFGDRVRLVGEIDAHGWRQKRYFDARALQFRRSQGRKARVAEGGGARVGANIGIERPVCLERADAAAQVAVLGEGDEGRTRLPECRVVRFKHGRCAQFRRDGVAGTDQQGVAKDVRHVHVP